MPTRIGSAIAATRAATPCSTMRRGSESVRSLSIACVIRSCVGDATFRPGSQARRPDFGNKKERVPGGTHSQKPTGSHPTVMRYPKVGQRKYSDLRRPCKGQKGRCRGGGCQEGGSRRRSSGGAAIGPNVPITLD